MSTAVQLRFNLLQSTVFPNAIHQLLLQKLSHRLTKEGVLIITCHTFRSQEQNRQEARKRLKEILKTALQIQPPRIPTQPSSAVSEKRLKSKARQAQRKALRQSIKGTEPD